jgi:hypothetical protein
MVPALLAGASAATEYLTVEFGKGTLGTGFAKESVTETVVSDGDATVIYNYTMGVKDTTWGDASNVTASSLYCFPIPDDAPKHNCLAVALTGPKDSKLFTAKIFPEKTIAATPEWTTEYSVA